MCQNVPTLAQVSTAHFTLIACEDHLQVQNVPECSCSPWLSIAHFRMIMTCSLLLFRWTQGLLKLLQQPLPPKDLQLAAAAVHAVSCMSHFVQHVQTDTSLYFMLTQAVASALQAGSR